MARGRCHSISPDHTSRCLLFVTNFCTVSLRANPILQLLILAKRITMTAIIMQFPFFPSSNIWELCRKWCFRRTGATAATAAWGVHHGSWTTTKYYCRMYVSHLLVVVVVRRWRGLGPLCSSSSRPTVGACRAPPWAPAYE
jgi:hypothetical protein